MNKQEMVVVVLLLGLLFAWFALRPPQAPRAVPLEPSSEIQHPAAEAVMEKVEPEKVFVPEKIREPEPAGIVGSSIPVVEEKRAQAEHTVALTGAKSTIVFSSWGGAVTSIQLHDYVQSLEADSGNVILDFSNQPALSLQGIPGLSTNSDFRVMAGQENNTIRISAVAASGLVFERTVHLTDDYRMEVLDAFLNTNSLPLTLPSYGMALGPMAMEREEHAQGGISYLGFDVLADIGGARVEHWAKKLPDLFGGRKSFPSCSAPRADGLPLSVTHRINQPLLWAAVKNKYFVQIMEPADAAEGEIQVERNAAPGSTLAVEKISGLVFFSEKVLAPGQQTERRTGFYVGPKKQSLLESLGNRQAEVMEFGGWEWFRWLCRTLLRTLNAIHGIIPNYGVAIILLTIIVKVVFWPVTHKSTESMKKMQQIQPLLNELRAKYKDDQKKMLQKQQELFKEHKVNPMMGCLPMLIQIPVFFALFTILRSAVELRFAGFLWIADLSEPEGLMAGLLPGGITLNILPIFMTVTMIWQQKLTPSAGDPQQQKMMAFMPVIMLFLFYKMASALVLYWSISQCLSIVQLLWQRRKRDPGKALAA